MVDGFKITMGILVGVLFLWVLINTLQISGVNSSISNFYNTYAGKYEITSITDRIKTIENKMIYEMPSKYIVDQHQTSIDNLFTRIGKCACSW
jgi:hypothetical protein